MKKVLYLSNVYYVNYINIIGGIEKHIYYLAKKYPHCPIAVVYTSGSEEQIEHLSSIVKCVKLEKNLIIHCECILSDALSKIPYERFVNYKKVCLILHNDYLAMFTNSGKKPFIPNNKNSTAPILYYGVSEQVCKSWKKMTNIDATCIYEPIIYDGNVLRIISATRLTEEKGKWRIVKLLEALDKNKVNYLYDIYTNDYKFINHPNVRFEKPIKNIQAVIKNYDLFVQLSDNEGYGLSVQESLLNKVPCLLTPCPVYEELNINSSVAIFVDFDMKKIPIDKIKNIKKIKVNYMPPNDRWEEILIHSSKSISAIKEENRPRLRKKIKKAMVDKIDKLLWKLESL